MTNFILRNPDLVFVHLPKTGGTSVKSALGSQIAKRFFGHIPDRYAEWVRFSIIRDPKARFLSALRMFKYGTDVDGDHYAQARWPDLTVSDALDVLEDPWVGFDRSQRTLSWNLKHHLIPQTHPFNCLHDVSRLLRFERLEDDFERLCSELGIATALPALRASRGPRARDEIWTASDERRFNAIFAEDYKTLGYSLDGPAMSVSAVTPRRSDPGHVFGLWPAYFSDQSIAIDRAQTALPRPDIPLEPFVDTIIPGQPAATWAGRSKDLNAHFHKLQPEFGGASRLSHLLACVIVVIRRDPECAAAHSLFWRIMEEQFEAIQAELSLRWLVAVADTMSDYGRDDAERATALSASIFANACKLHESELAVFYPKRPWPPKARVAAGGPLFDGMLSYWTEKGDLIKNMFARSADAAERSPVAGKVLIEVTERLRTGPTVYRRFGRISGQPAAPLVPEDVKRRMQRMMKRRL